MYSIAVGEKNPLFAEAFALTGRVGGEAGSPTLTFVLPEASLERYDIKQPNYGAWFLGIDYVLLHESMTSTVGSAAALVSKSTLPTEDTPNVPVLAPVEGGKTFQVPVKPILRRFLYGLPRTVVVDLVKIDGSPLVFPRSAVNRFKESSIGLRLQRARF